MKSKRPTIRDVARLAEVAPTTVSRVLNDKGYISDETRQRVEQAIAELNYIPNALSQSLRYQKTDTIALVVSDITNPFWTTVTRGVEDVCNQHDLHVILCNTDEQEQKLENYIHMLLQRQIDGVLLVPTSHHSTPIARRILQKQVPLVLLDRVVNELDLQIVRGDSEQGAYLLTRHLLELGHCRVAMLCGQDSISTSELRIAGYRRALSEYELTQIPSLLRFGRYTVQSGYEMMHELAKEVEVLPTAIFAANNFIAVGILKALHELNLKVPQDISVVSFDDLPYDTIPEPFLTVAAQKPYEMGRKAAELLIAQIQGEPIAAVEVVLPIELIIRQSSAPPMT